MPKTPNYPDLFPEGSGGDAFKAFVRQLQAVSFSQLISIPECKSPGATIENGSIFLTFVPLRVP
jgi:hypothetical protein